MVSCGGSGTLVTSGVGVVVTVPRTEVDTVSDGDGDSATFSRRCRGRNVNSDRARDLVDDLSLRAGPLNCSLANRSENIAGQAPVLRAP
jgi:hypothetical protein